MIGVTNDYQPWEGRPMKLIASPARRMERHFKNLLRAYGFSWGRYAPDHAWDLAWSGEDVVENLWPLGSVANRDANETYYQDVRWEGDNEDERTTNGMISMLRDRWFVIRTILNES
jgi:hypothetical protein